MSNGTGARGPDGGRVPGWLATGAAWSWRLLLLLTASTLILMVMVRLYLVTLPVIIALVLATLCVGPARFLERIGVPRLIAAFVVVLGGISAVVGVFVVIAPQFIDEARELGPTITDAIETLFGFLEDNFGWDRDEVLGWIDDGIAALMEQSGQIAQQLASGAVIVIQGITALVLAVILLFFFVKDGAQIVDWIIARTPDQHRETVRAVGRRAWTALTGFVRGTAAIALIDAVGIGIGLAILGVPLALPLGVLVFFGGLFPIVGAIVTGAFAVLVALADGGPIIALIALGIVVAVQQLESNILAPLVLGKATALHPLGVLTSLTAGGILLGVLGAFIAVPIAASLVRAIGYLRERADV
jgi:putative heme transporter